MWAFRVKVEHQSATFHVLSSGTIFLSLQLVGRQQQVSDGEKLWAVRASSHQTLPTNEGSEHWTPRQADGDKPGNVRFWRQLSFLFPPPMLVCAGFKCHTGSAACMGRGLFLMQVCVVFLPCIREVWAEKKIWRTSLEGQCVKWNYTHCMK